MKKSPLLILPISIVFFFVALSCRKVVPVEERDGVLYGNATCSNGVLDDGEDGIDCGPTCVPCNMSHAECDFTLTDNQFTISTTGVANFQASSVTSSVISGRLVISGTYGNKTIRVTFGEASPEVFKEYDLVEFGNPSAGEAKLEYVEGSYTYTGYSDVVHLNRESGKYTFEFCDVYMSSPSVGGSIVSRGRFLSSN